LETDKARVTVTLNDNLQFTGMGRSYRIAKIAAVKRALKHLRKLDQNNTADESWTEKPLDDQS
jgi:dsRNA-specific ribonuclease